MMPVAFRKAQLSRSTAILLQLCLLAGNFRALNAGRRAPQFGSVVLRSFDPSYYCLADDDHSFRGLADSLSFRGGSDGQRDGSDLDGESEEGGEYDDFENGEEDGPPVDAYDHSLIDPLLDDGESSISSISKSLPSDELDGFDDNMNGSRRRSPPPPVPRSRRGKPPKHWTQRLASQSLKMGSQLAWGAVQQTGKVAYQLVKPRHVDARELLGPWRLDQQIVLNGRDLASVASVELDPRKRQLTLKLPNGENVVVPYTFRKTRLGSFQTEFVVPAFLVGDTPRLYGYRGTWQRKLADKRVIKLVGKIYRVRQQRFGKSSGKHQFVHSIGTFVARRRMKLSEEDEEAYDDDDGASEYDGQDDEFIENEVDSEGYGDDMNEDL